MKFAVTGANGFVGQAITRELLRRGYGVRAAARTQITGLPIGAEWTEAPDLGAEADWSAVVAGVDIVIHCAARVHVLDEQSADPLATFRWANRDGTMALARAANRAGVKRLVFLSSIKVNGESTAPGRQFTAEDEPAPADAYAVSKAEAEAELRSFAAKNDLEIAIIRPVLVYGPGVRANFAALLGAVARGIPLPLGAINNRRSLIFLGNLTDLTIHVAIHPDANGQILLASDGEDMSTTLLLRRIGNALGKPARLMPVPPAILMLVARMFGRGAMADRLTGSLAVDSMATRARLGWQPPFDVAQGLSETTAPLRASTGHPS